MVRASSALKKRLEGLEQRLPAPRVEKPQPMHPTYAAHLFAATACMRPWGDFDDPTPCNRCSYPDERAACVAFWSGYHVNPVGERTGPATDRATAERMADLAWDLLPEVAEAHHPLSEHRESYLATHWGDCPRDDEYIRHSWLTSYGERGLANVLSEAITCRLEKRPVADPRLDELTHLVMMVMGPISLGGYKGLAERWGLANPEPTDIHRPRPSEEHATE
ncbi:MAG: hypothetical protein HRF45_09400 [Fimbriimonadia bacterium]|jgi:hypothetical protein